MIYFLIFMILILVGFIVWLGIGARKSKQLHLKKVLALQEILFELIRSNAIGNGRVQLSEELNEKIRINSQILGNDILQMIRESILTLSENNLLKK